MIEKLDREIAMSCNPETGCASDVVDEILTQSRDGEITFRETKGLVKNAIKSVLAPG